MSWCDSMHVFNDGFIDTCTYTKGEECLTIRAGDDSHEFAVYGMDSIRSLCSSLEEAVLFMQRRIDERDK